MSIYNPLKIETSDTFDILYNKYNLTSDTVQANVLINNNFDTNITEIESVSPVTVKLRIPILQSNLATNLTNLVNIESTYTSYFNTANNLKLLESNQDQKLLSTENNNAKQQYSITQIDEKVSNLTSSYNYYNNIINSTPKTQTQLLGELTTDYNSYAVSMLNLESDYIGLDALYINYKQQSLIRQNDEKTSYQNANTVDQKISVLQNQFTNYTTEYVTLDAKKISTESRVIRIETSYTTGLTNIDTISKFQIDSNIRINDLKDGNTGLLATVKRTDLIRQKVIEEIVNLENNYSGLLTDYYKIKGISIDYNNSISALSTEINNINSRILTTKSANTALSLDIDTINSLMLEVSPNATLMQPSNITNTTITLTGLLNNLGSETSVSCGFQYRMGANPWFTSSTVVKSTTGSFSVTISGLTRNITYEIQCVILGLTNSGNDYYTGSTFYQTTSTSTADANTLFDLQGITSTSSTSALDSTTTLLTNASYNSGKIIFDNNGLVETVNIAQNSADDDFIRTKPQLNYEPNISFQIDSTSYINNLKIKNLLASGLAVNDKVIVEQNGALSIVNIDNISYQKTQNVFNTSSNPRDMRTFKINGVNYVVVVNYSGWLNIYMFNGSDFILLQSLNAPVNSYGVSYLYTYDNKHTLIANGSNIAYSYIFNNSSNRFDLSGSCAMNMGTSGRCNTATISGVSVAFVSSLNSPQVLCLRWNGSSYQPNQYFSSIAYSEDTQLWINGSTYNFIFCCPWANRVYMLSTTNGVNYNFSTLINTGWGTDVNSSAIFTINGSTFIALTYCAQSIVAIHRISGSFGNSVMTISTGGGALEGINVIYNNGSECYLATGAINSNFFSTIYFNGSFIKNLGAKSTIGVPYTGACIFTESGITRYLISNNSANLVQIWDLNNSAFIGSGSSISSIYTNNSGQYVVSKTTPQLTVNVPTYMAKFNIDLKVSVTNDPNFPNYVNGVIENMTRNGGLINIIYTTMLLTGRNISIRVSGSKNDKLSRIQSYLWT